MDVHLNRRKRPLISVSKRQFRRRLENATINDLKQLGLLETCDSIAASTDNINGTEVNNASSSLEDSDLLISTVVEQSNASASFSLDSHDTDVAACSSKTTNIESCEPQIVSHVTDESLSDCEQSESSHLKSTVNDRTLNEDLASWAVDYNIPHNALSSLLNILRRHHDNVPKDSRTLLQTPKTVHIKRVEPGSYHHYGLSLAIEEMLLMYRETKKEVDVLHILVNVDGLPISKSSNACLWPILCSDTVFKCVHIVGIYHGYEKPKCSNEFLNDFVREAKAVVSNGVLYNEKLVGVRINGLICDTPAKAFVLNVKSHVGYFSCTKCKIEGEYYENRMIFSKQCNLKRTDKSFLSCSDEEYHKGETVLSSIPYFGCVTNVPIDYMHLICLGVVKKLLNMWLTGPLCVRLSASASRLISKKLIGFQETTPCEFSRRPRSLSEINHWKATELRQFMLYTGPVVLKDVLKVNVYSNFLTLHVAISILVSRKLSSSLEYVKYANNLLQHFVTSFEILYGKKFVSHNIHSLLHITADVEYYGPLDEFSAFKFENFMHSLKKVLRKHEKPLEQIARRYAEKRQNSSKENYNSSLFCDHYSDVHKSGPLLEDMLGVVQYQTLRTSSYVIKCNDGKNDCVLLKDGSVFFVLNIVFHQNSQTYFIIGYKGKSLATLYNKPCPSDILNISIVEKELVLKKENVKCVVAKVWQMKFNDMCVTVPISHTM